MKKEMKKEMKNEKFFHQQRTMETCGVACIIMALHAFGVIKYATADMEHMFYRMYGCRATKGTLGSAIAYALSMRRLSVRLVHELQHMVENGGGYYADEAMFEAIRAEHLDYIERAEGAFAVENGVPINAETIARELDGEHMVIAHTFIPGNADGMHDHVMHWVLISRYEDGVFTVCDPLSECFAATAQELEGYLCPPIGRSMIVVGKKK